MQGRSEAEKTHKEGAPKSRGGDRLRRIINEIVAKLSRAKAKEADAGSEKKEVRRRIKDPDVQESLIMVGDFADRVIELTRNDVEINEEDIRKTLKILEKLDIIIEEKHFNTKGVPIDHRNTRCLEFTSVSMAALSVDMLTHREDSEDCTAEDLDRTLLFLKHINSLQKQEDKRLLEKMIITIPEINAVFIMVGQFERRLENLFGLKDADLKLTIDLLVKLNFLQKKTTQADEVVAGIDARTVASSYKNQDIIKTISLIFTKADGLMTPEDDYETFTLDQIQKVMSVMSKMDLIDAKEKEDMEKEEIVKD
ncbi:hypothetical protein KA111_01530 [Candidatus Woesebacteria bacterium]|nr:hypothetical protein [Candidatus Woesebacteria bacterium]